jgi:hypothetical protein
MKAIKAGRLIDGRGGDPIENAVVLVDGNLLADITILQDPTRITVYKQGELVI